MNDQPDIDAVLRRLGDHPSSLGLGEAIDAILAQRDTITALNCAIDCWKTKVYDLGITSVERGVVVNG